MPRKSQYPRSGTMQLQSVRVSRDRASSAAAAAKVASRFGVKMTASRADAKTSQYRFRQLGPEHFAGGYITKVVPGDPGVQLVMARLAPATLDHRYHRVAAYCTTGRTPTGKRHARPCREVYAGGGVRIVVTTPAGQAHATAPAAATLRQLLRRYTRSHVRVRDASLPLANPADGMREGSGEWFRHCVAGVTRSGGAYDPKAVCAKIARRKVGAKKLAKLAAAGRHRAALARSRRANPAIEPDDTRVDLQQDIARALHAAGAWRPDTRFRRTKWGTLVVTSAGLGEKVVRHKALGNSLALAGVNHGYRTVVQQNGVVFVREHKGQLFMHGAVKGWDNPSRKGRRANPSIAGGYRCSHCGHGQFFRHHDRYLCAHCYELAPRGLRANPSKG